MSTINLLPEDYLRKRGQRRANMICLVLFVVVMAAVGGAALVSEQDFQNTLEVRDRVSRDYAEAARLIGQKQKLEERRSVLLAKAESTASLMERVPRSYLLSVFTNARPENIWLSEMQVVTAYRQPLPKKAEDNTKAGRLRRKARVPEPAETPSEPVQTWSEVTLVGHAQTDVEVARYISNLARNPLMQSVDLVYSKEAKVGDAIVREFELQVTTNANADVMEVLQPESPEGPLAHVQRRAE